MIETHCGDYRVRGHDVRYHYRRWIEYADGAEGTERQSYLQTAEYCLRDLAARKNRTAETAPSDYEPQTNSRSTRNHKRLRGRNNIKARA
jgi:hypothetical protein